MIRRISKNNDLKDLIKSCPSGVIDDITEIRYFISGHPETEIVATFEKVGSHLEVILPTSELSTLSNGVLMRRALYKVSDPAYPDGYYNLEFVDNMNVWLGEEDTAAPFDPGYLTEDDLKTINGESIVGEGNIEISVPEYYATKSWVSEQGYITSEELPEDIATKSWVSSQQFATQSWVSSQNFLTSTSLTGYATESWVQSQGYLVNDSVDPYATCGWVQERGYATEPWVEAQGYLTSAGLSGLATQSWVSSNFLSTTALTGYATESWVQSQGYLTSVPSEYATESWVSEQGYITSIPDTFATKAWVTDQGYLTSVPSEYATESWVSSNFLSTTALTGYATESWVSSNYVSATTLSSYTTFTDIDSYISSFWYRAAEEFYSDYVPRREIGSYLSGYATQSWVSSQFLETSKIWTGTSSQWAQLTPEQQAFYTIALVTE